MPTTFAQLRTVAFEHTKRPDLVAMTDLAIQTAVMRAHHVDFFPRDQYEAVVTYDLPGVLPYVDIPTLSQQSTIARLRAVKTCFGLEQGTYALVEQFEHRETDDFYDGEGYMRVGVYSIMGDTLRIVPGNPTGLLRVNYYRNPDVSVASFSSWIADLYPDFVGAWAAQGVLTRIGFREVASTMNETVVGPFKEMLISSHLLGEVN